MKKIMCAVCVTALLSVLMTGCSLSGSSEPTEPTKPIAHKVYTAGYCNNGSTDVPSYWEGTNRVDLPGDGTHYARAYSIYVSEGTVYTAGEYWNGSRYVPCFWTDGVRTDLPVDVNSIYVSEGTVFTAGFFYNGSIYVPCYWEGTARVDLPGDGSHNGEALAIFVECIKIESH